MPPAAGGDSLGALPDDSLHHVLSFLLAEDAVRTCVLARRWRHLWRFATSLHIVRDVDSASERVKAAREFVDHLLLLRGGSPLDTFELRLFNFEDGDGMSRIKLWIRHILMRKVRVLSLDIHRDGCRVGLDGLTLISNHLRKLRLSDVDFEDKLLDFSCCPALEVLEIDECDFSFADTISSQSLKCLSIGGYCFFNANSRILIYAPNLQSLRLELNEYRTPVLERMPSLAEAFVKIGDSNSDCCPNSAGSGDCEHDDCFACYGVDGDTDNSVLLQGLSKAQNLVLISDVEIFIFRRDLKWRPKFVNLKSLLLNEYWCVPADFSALAYMLEHSPILEKLTLQLYCKGHESKVEMKGILDPTERSAAISEHLKSVEVKCEVVDDKVLDVLKFLSKLRILFSFLRN